MKRVILAWPRRILWLGYVLETQTTSGQSPSSVFGEFNRAAECPLSTLGIGDSRAWFPISYVEYLDRHGQYMYSSFKS